MHVRQINITDAREFVAFYDTLVSQTSYLLHTIQEAHKPVSEQEVGIRKFNEFKQVFVAIEDGRIVGFIGLTRYEMSKVRHIATFALGVLAEYRRRGIAFNLVTVAEKWLMERGVSRIEMTVIADNLPAISLYEKLGFRHEGIRKRSIKMNNKYYDELFMAKDI